MFTFLCLFLIPLLTFSQTVVQSIASDNFILIKTNDNSTCLLGSSLTEDMRLFQQIVKNRTKINLALDSDVYYKTLKIAKLLSEYDIEVDILDTRGHEDVGDMSRDVFDDLLNNTKKYEENDSLLSKIRSL